jgi:hypothetical protein
MNKYISRLTSSARGEVFNPLTWPFLLATFAYGVGFSIFYPYTDALGTSSAFTAMYNINPAFPQVWGIMAVLTIVLGITFLLFNIPPFGKVSGLVGFALWLFVAICYAINGDWLVMLSVSLPNMWFWIWQYLSLSLFRREDAEDKQTMADYDAGGYDDNNGGKALRESNRGVDRQ